MTVNGRSIAIIIMRHETMTMLFSSFIVFNLFDLSKTRS
jgi:hypothetical protein